jgi:hypothetical protein
VQELLVHTLPTPQSASAQQLPLTQAPPQHFCPALHCASLVHRLQRPDAPHTRPPVQSPVVQQFPALQVPPQHTLPTPHCALLVQAAHCPPRHVLPAGQSAREQHWLVVQAPLQQRPPGPQSPSAPHVLHWLPKQTYWPHWLVVQQLPSLHAPLQHTRPAPHWAEVVHAVHCEKAHTCPLGHSWPGQQVPCLHAPLQHTWPAPHCASLVQAWHALPMHPTVGG